MALCRSGRGLLRTEPISLACITVRSAHANFDPSIPRIYKIGSTPLSMQKFVMPLKSFNPTPQGFVRELSILLFFSFVSFLFVCLFV